MTEERSPARLPPETAASLHYADLLGDPAVEAEGAGGTLGLAVVAAVVWVLVSGWEAWEWMRLLAHKQVYWRCK